MQLACRVIIILHGAMDSSPSRGRSDAPSTAGTKRPASLLPPFEPLTSSPSLPRPVKRLARETEGGISTYPTPVPTSSTLVPTSSPPQLPNSRPLPLKRTHSMVSERAPLSTVPSVMLNVSGEPILMGRSSASSHYQLSANRLISRIHVQANYKPTDNPFDRDRVEILCKGWNGIKLHCQGKTYDLAKGKTFTSDIKDADIMIDVQDARVLVQWPRPERKDSGSSDRAWEEDSPSRNARRSQRRTPPLRERQHLASPVSPSPAVQALIPPSSPLLPHNQDTHSQVVVYEDEPSPTPKNAAPNPLNVSQTTQVASQGPDENCTAPSSSPLSDAEELSEHDEENDPIIHSFGPFGDNILSRMTSFNAGTSPSQPARAQPLKAMDSPPQPSTRKSSNDAEKASVENHVANQLAFSRLSSTPLSTILSNLPPGLWNKASTAENGLTTDEIRDLLETVQCIGKITREGKDAAGKALESEYHYIPDRDEDEKRREAVVNGLMKPGLRNCRKQHKVRSVHTISSLPHIINVIFTAIFLAQAQIIPSSPTKTLTTRHRIHIATLKSFLFVLISPLFMFQTLYVYSHSVAWAYRFILCSVLPCLFEPNFQNQGSLSLMPELLFNFHILSSNPYSNRPRAFPVAPLFLISSVV